MIEVVSIPRCKDFGTLSGDLYIGRQTRYGGKMHAAGKYANPFPMGAGCSRSFVIRKYVDYLYETGLVNDVQKDLRNVKRLGCWCKPLPCHGDILVGIVEQGPARFRENYTGRQCRK